MLIRKFLPNTMMLALKRKYFTNVQPESVEAAPEEPTPMIISYKTLSRKEQAKLITDRLMSLDATAENRRNAARELKALKAEHKVSWEKLGVNQDHLRMLEVLLADEPKPARISKKTKALSQAFHASEETEGRLTINERIRLERNQEIKRLAGLGFSQVNIAHRMGITPAVVSRALRQG